MFLNLKDIIEMPGKFIPFECDIPADNLDFPSVREYIGLPHAVGRVYNEAGMLLLEGSLTAEMVCTCDRCCAEFQRTKVTELNAVLVEEESDDNPELFVLEGDGIELDEVLSTLFILDMETKFLCSEDCKGICPGCGVNLNHGECTCRKKVDPRFAVLEQLLDK